MLRRQPGPYLIQAPAPGRVLPHGAIHRCDLLSQPLLNSPLTRKQGPQSVTDYLAFRGVLALATLSFTFCAISWASVMLICLVDRIPSSGSRGI
jgi:hypothetical protein